METQADVKNSKGSHQVNLETDKKVHTIQISYKSTGFGSSTNGGEQLFLALATCYCNDIWFSAKISKYKHPF